MQDSLVSILRQAAWVGPVSIPWVMSEFSVSRNTAGSWMGEVLEKWPDYLERKGRKVAFKKGEPLPREASARVFSSLYFCPREISLVWPSVSQVFSWEILEVLLEARRDGAVVNAAWVSHADLKVLDGILFPRFFSLGVFGPMVVSQQTSRVPVEEIPLSFLTRVKRGDPMKPLPLEVSALRSHYRVGFSPNLGEDQRLAVCRLLGISTLASRPLVALTDAEYRRMGLVLSSFGVSPVSLWPA